MRIWQASLGVMVVAAAGVAYFIMRDGTATGPATAHAAAAPFAMPVPVTNVVRKTVPIYLEYSARTESISSVTLQAKVSGYLQEQAVPDGTDVKEGELLYRIDPRDFEAALDQVKAQAQRDTALLAYTRVNLNRGSTLTKDGWIAKDDFDQRTSTMGQAQAALAADQAAIRAAELNLSRTEIRAPFAGRLGRNQAPAGTLVSVAGTVLNTLVQLDPIYVTFNPSETDLAEITQARAARGVEAEILVPGDTQALHHGQLTFIDNAVDRATGTITARATIGNADFTLLPGQYVRVRLHVRDDTDALMVPETALGSSQLGKYVYVVGAGNKVDLHLVSLGVTADGLVAVKGVAEGDQVIVGNLQKIGPGALVQPLPPPAAPATDPPK